MEPLPNPDPQARRVGALLGLMLDLFKTDVGPTSPGSVVGTIELSESLVL